MLNVLAKFSQQASLYTGLAGKIWYILVYIFRVIIVVSIGDAVYRDEQSEFKCSTHIVGCENVCYDQFSKLPHLRFWAFQLLALNTPVIFFHFYALYERGEHENRRRNGSPRSFSRKYQPVGRASDKSRKISGPPKPRRKIVATEYGSMEIYKTANTEQVYFITTIFRVLIELLFLCFAYQLFSFPTDPAAQQVPFDLSYIFWPTVPQFYACYGEYVSRACGQHLALQGAGGYVPCWVSRPWEKTIFLRYMNWLSIICFFLALIETIYIASKIRVRRRRKRILRYKNFAETKLCALKRSLPSDYSLTSEKKPGSYKRISRVKYKPSSVKYKSK
ncbi:gap junction beta-6 protein-like [Clavelina lepadiformis]|uniref:gap junction beta-6 protein-like n=1 Tax=Clavelina lepadiformis TaxID=159417 RepID=UPI0040434214